MKKIILIVCLNWVLLAFANEAEQKTYTLGVLYWSSNIPGQVAMKTGLQRQFKQANQLAEVQAEQAFFKLIEKTAGDGSKGIENQIKQMQTMIDSNPDLIIVQPTDNAALVEGLILANQKSIPVIAYDQYILQGELVSYITSNNYQAGFLNGEVVADHFPDSQTINIVLVDYPYVSSTVERVDGFLDALRQLNQPYRLVGTYQAVEPKAGFRVGHQILSHFPEKGMVDLIFTVNDGGGESIYEIITKAGREEIKFATVDGDPEMIQYIRDGQNTILVDSAQLCAALGQETAKIAIDFLKGKPVPKMVKLPVFPVTTETQHQYSGWLGDIPKSFVKPWPSSQTQWQGSIQIN